MYKRTFSDYFFLYLKGIAMGSANKVPGVSGGMVSLVLNFYEELIYTFQKFNTKALNLVLKGRFKSFFNYINYKFLLSVFLGSFTAYFTVSLLLDYLLERKEIIVWSLFFGMVLGSIYYVSQKIKSYTPQTYLIIFLGSILGLGVSLLDPMPPNQQIWFVIICGIISVSGMTLPGFSGSFILIILGNYVLLMVDAVNNVADIVLQIFNSDFSFLQNQDRMHLLSLIVYFTLGSLIGMIVFSKIMGYLLKNFHDKVIAALMGFIIGSLGATWPWKITHFKKDENGIYLLDSNHQKIVSSYKRVIPNELNQEFVYALICILVGFVLVWLIDYFENRNKKTPI